MLDWPIDSPMSSITALIPEILTLGMMARVGRGVQILTYARTDDLWVDANVASQ